MCGRYGLALTADEFYRTYNAQAPLGFTANDRISAGKPGTVIRLNADSEREALTLPWGSTLHDGKPLLNARGETVATKPTFRAAFALGRVLVPATAFWERGHRMHLKHHPFALAGIAGGDRFWIVTAAASPATRAVHDRVPVVLEPGDWDQWLAPDARAYDLLRAHEGVRTNLAAARTFQTIVAQSSLFARLG
jgi:putative SOS response-associated peptidase YedK